MLQSSTISQGEMCAFCEDDKEGDLALMMSEAVYAKHAINHAETYISYIDSIMKLQEPNSKEEAVASYQHQEYLHLDERDEYLKREYSACEFEGKIAMLTQYYKFHSNIPRVIQSKIQRILGKYHDKKREHDYKRIKRLLKEEQGISITSVQESESDFTDSRPERSRYSSLLHQLNQTDEKFSAMSDSNVLKDLCTQIERVLPSRKKDGSFQIKGAFYQDTIFQRYIKQEEQKSRERLRLRNQDRRTSFANNIAKRLNLNILSGREKPRKEPLTKPSKQLRRKEKTNKFVYNTNIKVEIKNALFCTDQHFKANFEQARSNSKNAKKNSLFKKKIMNPLNLFDSRQPSSRFLNQIYKSSHNDSKKKIAPIPPQRVTTKESINRSQSKDRKRSLTKYTSQGEMKKSGPSSARKLVYGSSDLNQNSASKTPSRVLSAANLKGRSFSNSQSASASTSLASSSKRKNVYSFQKRPIELISNYGSSNLKEGRSDAKGKQQKMTDVISRKLTLKVS